MTSASKRKGSAWERDLCNYLRENKFEAERLRQTGRDDEGDLVIRFGGSNYTLIEAKAENRIDLAGYLREAETERKNFARNRSLDLGAVDPLVVIKRRMASVGQAYVVTTLDRYLGIEAP